MENLKPINYKFYKFMLVDGKLEFVHDIQAKPIELTGYEGIDMFIIKHIENNLIYWRISESYVGFKIYSSIKNETKADAMQNAIKLLQDNKCTKKELIKRIKVNIDKWALSPRYQ